MGQGCSIRPQIALGFHLGLDRALTIAETCVETAGRGCVDRNPQEAGLLSSVGLLQGCPVDLGRERTNSGWRCGGKADGGQAGTCSATRHSSFFPSQRTLEIEMLLVSQAFPELLSDLRKRTLDSSVSSVIH